MNQSILLRIPMAPDSWNKRERQHWAEKARSKEAWAKALVVCTLPNERTLLRTWCREQQKVKITIEVQHPRLFDQDNIAVKPILDAMREVKFIFSDAPAYMSLTVKQFQDKEKQTLIVVRKSI